MNKKTLLPEIYNELEKITDNDGLYEITSVLLKLCSKFNFEFSPSKKVCLEHMKERLDANYEILKAEQKNKEPEIAKRFKSFDYLTLAIKQ